MSAKWASSGHGVGHMIQLSFGNGGRGNRNDRCNPQPHKLATKQLTFVPSTLIKDITDLLDIWNATDLLSLNVRQREADRFRVTYNEQIENKAPQGHPAPPAYTD